ncbi:AEC family transporter [Mongoliitalea daihaiensis]|uniref:AEC family transporter n=1 Tax=Mongoliitalea daihaiensis TaxID=2782006 RepID=UPI001F20DEB1|nr:permease [Mongoliitalea daihaiensis]UJP64591.1 permease [Mongoliitalea daihaiensis]
MNPAIQKTLAFLLLLLIGFFLRAKFQSQEQQKGLKTIILTIALPAIIFVALLKAEISQELLWLPVLALGFNFILFFALQHILPWYGIEKGSPNYRTYLLLFPSLAPGLSCFPFLIEYLGDEALAWGALADIGNKFFVLIFAYMVAIHWFFKIHPTLEGNSRGKIKSLLVSLINEPINLVIVFALTLLAFGIRMENLPPFLSSTISSLSNLMTPLVLLYIGIAVVFNWAQLKKIVNLLLLRSGLTFMLSGLLILLVPGLSYIAILLIVVFPQSAISFWPYAHMSAIQSMERLSSQGNKKTFDLELGVNILALSLPFATGVMLSVFSFGETFTSPNLLISLGIALVSISAIKPTYTKISESFLKPVFKKD